MVTARELVVVSGSFMSRSNVSETAPPFTWSCEPREIRSLQCWMARNKSPRASPATGLKPGSLAWGAATLPLLVLCSQVAGPLTTLGPGMRLQRTGLVHLVLYRIQCIAPMTTRLSGTCSGYESSICTRQTPAFRQLADDHVGNWPPDAEDVSLQETVSFDKSM